MQSSLISPLCASLISRSRQSGRFAKRELVILLLMFVCCCVNCIRLKKINPPLQGFVVNSEEKIVVKDTTYEQVKTRIHAFDAFVIVQRTTTPVVVLRVQIF